MTESRHDRAYGVVVGYDGSPSAEVAVRWAAAEARRRQRPLAVIHAIDFGGLEIDPTATHVDDWPGPALDAGRATADAGVALAARTAPGVRVHGAVATGPAAQVLVEESHRAELLVVGTRGRGDLAVACLGSVAAAVATHAACPTVIVRGEQPVLPGPGHRVVVGVDGSPASLAALDVASELAADAGAVLHIVAVWNAVGEQAWMAAYASGLSRGAVELVHAERNRARNAVETAALRARGGHPTLEITTDTPEGNLVSSLLAAAEGAGMLVVGTRGHGAFTSLVLGSVSHGVVHAGHGPVMVVRSPEAVRRTVPEAAPVHVML